MKRSSIGLVCLIAVVLVTGCSTKKSTAYLNSHNGKNLVVTRPLSKHYINNEFVLPEVGKAKPQSVAPPSQPTS